ncbi:MAG: NAD(P)-dependent oxidoreductase, partial [Nanoarchaeota archaeon]|nr:NAD(P)-dependent oxidoreductase [Nanoarchaeota archaeon]
KVFITGALGFVGKELVAKCKEKDIEVVAVDIVEDPSSGCINADIRSKDIDKHIPEGADAVIHLAGLTRDPDCKNKGYECFDANVMATLNLINAAEKKNAKQFIFASSEWVYGDFKEGEIKDEDTLIDISGLGSEYALSKLVSEANLRQKFSYGFCPVTILRFGIIYGTRKANWSAVEAVFNSVRTKDLVEVGSLKTGRCFLHVKDIADGIIKSIGKQGFKIINLEGDSLVTLADIIEASKKITGKDPEIKEKDPENISIRNVSNKKAVEMLRWKPSITLEQGLEKLKILLEEE